MTACVPTIWLVGVTSGGNPRSSRTAATSLSTCGHFVERVLHFELRTEIRYHAAGDLVDQDFGIDIGKRAAPLPALGREFGEKFRDPLDCFHVEIRRVVGLLENGGERLDRRLRGETGHGRNGAVDGARTGPHALDIGGDGHAA